MKGESVRLGREFFDRECETVAIELLGKVIVRNIGNRKMMARIVETEAYLGPHDKAGHASKGRTARTEILFGPPGFVYMFLIYGIHNMLNITTRDPGAAVLIRAVEPIMDITAKTSGPGLLAKALDLTREHYGIDLTTSEEIYVMDDGYTVLNVSRSARIGVDYAGEWKDTELRFFISDNKHVSRAPKSKLV